MIHVIIYCILQTQADTDVQILAMLYSGEWKNQNQIHERVGTRRDRLSDKLDVLKKLGHIRNDWNDLTKQEQKKYMKDHPNFEPKGVKHFYRITTLGYESFRKIRDDCLDEDTARILRVTLPDDTPEGTSLPEDDESD